MHPNNHLNNKECNGVAVNMFGKKHSVKYTAIDKAEDITNEEETVDFEPMKRKFCTPSCLWSAVFTGALIGTYYIPSVGLTFYQRWLLQVGIYLSVTFNKNN